MDYTRKVLAGDFHPKKNLLAVASLNRVYVYIMWFIARPYIWCYDLLFKILCPSNQLINDLTFQYIYSIIPIDNE